MLKNFKSTRMFTLSFGKESPATEMNAESLKHYCSPNNMLSCPITVEPAATPL